MWRPTQGARRAGRRRREAETQKAYQSSDPWMTLVGRRRGRWGKVVAAKMERPEGIQRGGAENGAAAAGGRGGQKLTGEGLTGDPCRRGAGGEGAGGRGR